VAVSDADYFAGYNFLEHQPAVVEGLNKGNGSD
jgi:hypothetical protein